MPNNIVILGNGFDLSLGLPTKYVDFVNSSHWPIKDLDSAHFGEPNLYNFLYQYIQSNKDTLGNVRWIDLENLLLQYALSKSEQPVYFKDEKEIIKYDQHIFQQIKESFIRYIVDVVSRKGSGFNLRHCVGSQVISQIANNKTFKKIYSFNYTNTSSVLDFICNWKPEIIHIHGQAYTYNNHIILGIGSGKGINKEYKFFLKDRQKGFVAHDLNEDLFSAEQIVFYGISFGGSDFTYFKRFFEEVVRNHTSKDKKKLIHIFTYDDESKAAIADAFEDSGLEMREIFSCIDIRFYLEKDFSLSINGRNEYEIFRKLMLDTMPKTDSLVTAEVEKFMDDRHYDKFEY